MAVQKTSPMNQEQPFKKTDLLRRIGGPSCLESVAISLSTRIKLDQRLEMFFTDFNMEQLTSHQAEFLSVALAETHHTCRSDIESFVIGQHKHLFDKGLNETQYDMIMQHFHEVLEDDIDMEQDVIVDAMKVLGSFRQLFAVQEHITRNRKSAENTTTKRPKKQSSWRKKSTASTSADRGRESVGRSHSGEGLLAMFQVKSTKRKKNVACAAGQ